MGRLPFDPSRMRGPAPSPGDPPGEGVLTVSRLAALIRATIEQHLPARIRVLGEVSGLRRATHLYFSLKDADAVIGAVVFASTLRKVGFDPRDGQEVIATGRLEFYEPQGRLTLIVERLEPVGEGALEIRFRQLCDELRKLGWFDPERKRPLPTFPRRVAVVTSPSGAALQDVIVTMHKRCPAVGVAVVPVRVQGEGAAGEVVRALHAISAHHDRLGIDAVIVTRGGGSPEDLAAFNERAVAEAILHCAIPVVAAIGHETDTTIAELVADERCATPTHAAMRLTPDAHALGRQLDALGARLRAHAGRALRFERQRLESAARRPALADPRSTARAASRRLDHLAAELEGASSHAVQRLRRRLDAAALALERRQPRAVLAHARATQDAHAGRFQRALRHTLVLRSHEVDGLARRLDAVGPGAVLRRGYSCTRRPDGAVVRDATDLRPGERLTTYVALGAFRSEVVDVSRAGIVDPGPGAAPARPAPADPPRRKGARAAPRDQLDLFGGAG